MTRRLEPWLSLTLGETETTGPDAQPHTLLTGLDDYEPDHSFELTVKA